VSAFIVGHVTIFLTFSLIAMQNLFLILLGESQKIGGSWGPTPFWIWDVADPRNMLLPTLLYQISSF